MTSPTYDELISRNHTYIDDATQTRIRACRLLIAGVGMGSAVAEAAIRLGFETLTLIDGDVVEPHNLNRQAFTAADIGQPKVNAIANRLKAINPSAKIRCINGWLDAKNAVELVDQADMVFDAIDFLSLEAIVALHDATRLEKKPIVSVASAGFGALAVYFGAQNPFSIRDCFGLPTTGAVTGASYTRNFATLFRNLAGSLDPLLVTAMEKTFSTMEDAKPCPAPHLVIGSSAMAALAMTIAVRVLSNQPVAEAPNMILFGIGELCTSATVRLTQPG